MTGQTKSVCLEFVITYPTWRDKKCRKWRLFPSHFLVYVCLKLSEWWLQNIYQSVVNQQRYKCKEMLQVFYLMSFSNVKWNKIIIYTVVQRSAAAGVVRQSESVWVERVREEIAEKRTVICNSILNIKRFCRFAWLCDIFLMRFKKLNESSWYLVFACVLGFHLRAVSISVHREGVNPSSMEGVLDLSDHISVKYKTNVCTYIFVN